MCLWSDVLFTSRRSSETCIRCVLHMRRFIYTFNQKTTSIQINDGIFLRVFFPSATENQSLLVALKIVPCYLVITDISKHKFISFLLSQDMMHWKPRLFDQLHSEEETETVLINHYKNYITYILESDWSDEECSLFLCRFGQQFWP